MQQLPTRNYSSGMMRDSNMVCHVFLTGEKHVGKSTLMKKILDRYIGDARGFLTVRTNEYLKDSYSVHLFRLGEENVPNEDNLLFICGKSGEAPSERFDRLGCEALSECSDGTLILMDELGPHEADATSFRAAVLKLLDGTIPILGVLQAPAESSWPDIVRHPNVQIIEISKRNRDDSNVIDDILSALINVNS